MIKDDEIADVEEGSTKEKELALFWEERTRKSSYWSLIVNTLQFLSTLSSILDPDSEEQESIAPIYMGCSVIAYVCLYLYFANPKKFKTLAYWVSIYVIVRTCIRLFDFENTRA